MPERQIYISLEIVTVIAVLLGIGLYLYFVGNPLKQLGGSPFAVGGIEDTLGGSLTPAVVASPTPVAVGLPARPADLVGTVWLIKEQSIVVEDREGVRHVLKLKNGAPLYLIPVDRGVVGSANVQVIKVKNLRVGDTVSVYLMQAGRIEAVTVTRP